MQGKDATEEYEPIHPPDTLDKFLDKAKHLGPVDMSTVEVEEKVETAEEKERQERITRMPILDQCYNLMDFEAVARQIMKKTAWAYYSSGADDEIVSIYLLSKDGRELTSIRQCERTIRHSTKFGFDPAFWLMLRKSTFPPPCWGRKSIFHSTLPQLLWGS